MKPTAAFLLSLSLLAATPGQTPLDVVLDATSPGGTDNTAVRIVQESLHPAGVLLDISMTGDPGWVGVPFISLEGDPRAGNTTLLDLFPSLAPDRIVFPKDTFALATYLLTYQPFFPMQPTLDPFPPVVVGGDFDTTVCAQLAAQLIGGPSTATSISDGITLAFLRDPDPLRVPAPAPTAGAWFGRSLAAGDLDGDGVDDLVVGAPGETVAGLPRAGRVYIYLGVAQGGLSGVPFILEETFLPGIGGTALNPGPEAFAEFGHAVLLADFDGDGRDELVVGVRRGDGPIQEPDTGEVYAYLELDTLLTASPAILEPAPEDVRVIGPAVPTLLAQFGYSLASGDVNGDGTPDLAVGAPFTSATGAGNEAGRAYVFLGPILPPPPPPAPPIVFESFLLKDGVEAAYDRFGSSLALADLDGDGRAELAVGVPGEAHGATERAGKVVVFGFPAGGGNPIVLSEFADASPGPFEGFGLALAASDLNGDGRADLVAGNDDTRPGLPFAGQAAARFYGPALSVESVALDEPGASPFNQFGNALAAFDLNDDDIQDLVIGAPSATAGGMPYAGLAWVLIGRHASPVTGMADFGDAFSRVRLQAAAPSLYGGFGSSFAAGDFDGDGVRDLVIGAWKETDNVNGHSFAGAVHIVHDLLKRRTSQFPPAQAQQSP